MSSKVIPRIPIDRSTIENMKTVDDVKQWLRRFIVNLDEWVATIYDNIENGGLGTPNWNVKEATAADVTAGNAVAAGNLIVEHKTEGTKHEFEV